MRVISLSEKRKRMILAGDQATIAYGGTSLLTKELAPITAPLPIFTHRRIIESTPTHTSFPNIQSCAVNCSYGLV